MSPVIISYLMGTFFHLAKQESHLDMVKMLVDAARVLLQKLEIT